MEYREIQHIAESKFNEGEGVIPTPVIAIAQNEGMKVYEVAMPETDGVAPSGVLQRTDDGEWVILVNERDAPTRKRFTIAHEVGHYLLHRDELIKPVIIDNFRLGEVFYRKDAANEKEKTREKEANYFAACLLMPEETIKRKWPDARDIADLADQFIVSEVSMTYRLRYLGLIEGGQ